MAHVSKWFLNGLLFPTSAVISGTDLEQCVQYKDNFYPFNYCTTINTTFFL